MSGAVRRGPLRMRDLLPHLKALAKDGEDEEACDEEPQPLTPATPVRAATYKVGLRAATPRSARGRSTPLKMRQTGFTPAQRSTGKRSKVKYSLFAPESNDAFAFPTTKSDDDAFAVPKISFDASFERLKPTFEKFSTPQSSNLSTNAILREHRDKDAFTPADSNNRRPLFPVKQSSFKSNPRNDDPHLYSISEKENSYPSNSVHKYQKEEHSIKNSSNNSLSDSKNATATEVSIKEENRSQIHITHMDPSPPSENHIKHQESSIIPAFDRPPIRVNGAYFPPKPPPAPYVQPIREIRETKPTHVSPPFTKQYAQMSLKGKFYTVLGKCGSGGSSDVYKVMDPDNSTMFAIKCVNMAVDESVAESYVNEIKLLQRLQGSNRVITMFDYEYVKHQKKLYVLLEMGETDLSSLLKYYRMQDSFLPFPLLVGYWTEMLTAVNHIHKNGIIHSDLKPANFLLVHGRLKLIDFGIASSLNADATSVMKESTVGTFNYISPEAITLNGTNAAAKVSYKSDVWSLGCILYSMLYGRTPFSHVRHLYAKIAVLSNPNQAIDYPQLKGLPAVLMRALKWCLTWDVKRRPTVQELIDLPYLNSEGTSASEENLPLEIILKIKSGLSDDEWSKFYNFIRVRGAK